MFTPSGRLAFMLYWRALRSNRRLFWRALFFEVFAMMLFECNTFIVPVFLFREYAQRDTEAAARWTGIFLAILIFRSFFLNLALKTVNKLEIEGFTNLIEIVHGALKAGMDQSQGASLSGAATRMLMAWRTFSIGLCVTLLSSVTCLTVSVVILSVRQPLLLLPFVVIITAYSFMAWRLLTQGRPLAETTALSQNKLITSVEALVATRSMRWMFKGLSLLVNARKTSAKSDMQRHRLFSIRYTNALRHAEWWLYSAILLALLWLCSLSEDKMPVAQFIGMAYIFMTFVITSTLYLMNIVRAIESTAGAVGDAVPMSNELAVVPVSTRPVAPVSGVPRIEVAGRARGITYDLVIEPGITVLQQPSGAGKSTLLALMAGNLLPEVGHVKFCGYTTADYDISDFVVLVAQNLPALDVQGGWLTSNHLTMSLGSLATSGGPLDTTGLLHERSLNEMSGGERTVVYIEAAVHECWQEGKFVLLLDEPTNGLDARRVELLLEGLTELAQAPSAAHWIIVIASHDPRVWAIATRPAPMW